MANKLFELGNIVATPGAIRAMKDISSSGLLNRHRAGDWGDLCEDDKGYNDEAVKDGSRIMSAYDIGNGVKIWIITEAEGENGKREATTFLLPDEY